MIMNCLVSTLLLALVIGAIKMRMQRDRYHPNNDKSVAHLQDVVNKYLREKHK